MTCIATDGRTMAGDGRVTANKSLILTDEFEKVIRLSDGRVLGGSGDMRSVVNAAKWMNAGGDPEDPPELDEDAFEGLVLDADGNVHWYDDKCVLVPYSPPCAIGAGAEIALAAMRRGRSPKEAVAEAAANHATVGGRIRTLRPRK